MLEVKKLRKDIIATPFVEYLPSKCEVCGGSIVITETLSYIECSNPQCAEKMGHRLHKLIKKLGINNLSKEKCIEIVETTKISSPFSFFNYDYELDGQLLDLDKQDSQEITSKLKAGKSMLVWEYVHLGTFDTLSDVSHRLFEDCTDLKAFYRQLDLEGIPLIQTKLVGDIESSMFVEVIVIYDLLQKYKDELLTNLKNVHIINPKYSIGMVFANNLETYDIKGLNHSLGNNIYIYINNAINSNTKLVYIEDLNNYFNTTLLEEAKRKGIKITSNKTIHKDLLEVVQRYQICEKE